MYVFSSRCIQTSKKEDANSSWNITLSTIAHRSWRVHYVKFSLSSSSSLILRGKSSTIVCSSKEAIGVSTSLLFLFKPTASVEKWIAEGENCVLSWSLHKGQKKSVPEEFFFFQLDMHTSLGNSKNYAGLSKCLLATFCFVDTWTHENENTIYNYLSLPIIMYHYLSISFIIFHYLSLCVSLSIIYHNLSLFIMIYYYLSLSIIIYHYHLSIHTSLISFMFETKLGQ